MLNMLLSPNGRMSSSEFTKAALILIGLGLLLSLPEALGMSKGLSSILGMVSILLLIPWVFIWIKRYHDAGKSGVMCLIPIVVYIILLTVLMMFMLGDVFSAMFSAASEGASQSETQAQMESMVESKTMSLTIASTILSVVVALGFNAMIKGDPGENQFGPAT